MLCSVLPTHRAGVRIEREELRTLSPAMGNLLVGQHEGNPVRRGPYARLAARGPTVMADPLLPLFDARLVRVVDDGFLLQGYEIEVREGVARELVQGWWCKPA